MCRGKWNKQMCLIMLLVGIASLLYGLLSFLIIQPEGHSQNTLLGMFTGFGAGICAVAVFRMIREKVVSKEKLEQEEIDRQDERNIAISRAAFSVGYCVAFGLIAVLIFLFMGLGYPVPSYICLAVLYLTAGAAFIARKVLENKM